MKTCSKCESPKDVLEFNRCLAQKDGLSVWCRECSKVHSRGRKRNPLAEKIAHLKCTYGLSLGDWNRIRAEQSDRCAICREKTDQFVVDHDHKTEAVRGLLCLKCNTGLGMFKDSKAILFQASEYLEKHSPQTPNIDAPPELQTGLVLGRCDSSPDLSSN